MDDDVIDGDVAYNVITSPAESEDPIYDGENAGDVWVTNLDMDMN